MKTSKDPRHLARKVALQTLFQWSSRPDLPTDNMYVTQEALEGIAESIQYDEQNPVQPKISMAKDIISGVIENKKEIDDIIEKCAPEWPIDQIAKVDVNILRISIFELLYRDETPLKVAIDEAVELAKEFGSDASSKFVNGVLGTVVKDYVPEEKKEKKPKSKKDS